VLRDQGKYEQAEEMHLQGLGLSETVFQLPLFLVQGRNVRRLCLGSAAF
jgi:hypothetical protein